MVHACVEVSAASGLPVTSTGNLRIIDPSVQTCSTQPGAPATERALSWNQAGPPGLSGPTGAPGTPGAPGAPGRTAPVLDGHTLTLSGGNVITVGGAGALTIAPPTIRSSARPIAQVTLGTGRGALQFGALATAFALGTTAKSTGRGAGNASPHEIVITKLVDKATTKLSDYCSTGKHLPSVQIEFSKAGGAGKPVKYLVYKLKDVLVAAVQIHSAQGSSTPQEDVTLTFSQIEIKSS